MTPSALPRFPLRRTRTASLGLEALLFLAGIAVVALHVADDSFLQPQPGTSAADHLVSGLVPLALLGLAAWRYPRTRGGARAVVAVVAGLFGVAAGAEAVYYAQHGGPTGDDFTGLLSIPAGLLLVGVGVTTLWRTRRRDGHVAKRIGRRALLAMAAFVVAPLGFLVLFAYVATHAARPPVEHVD